MKYIPFYNDATSFHLTLADWESLSSSRENGICLAVDVLNLFIHENLLFPENVRTIILCSTPRSCHTISGINKRTDHFFLHSPYNGRRILVTPEYQQNQIEQLQKKLSKEVKVMTYEEADLSYEVSEKATCDGDKGLLYRGKNDIIDLKETDCVDVLTPINVNCHCYTCQHFTIAYLHHLHKVGVLLWKRLSIVHNLYFQVRIGNTGFQHVVPGQMMQNRR